MERRHFGLLISAVIASSVLKASPVRDKQASVEEHIAWVGEVLTRMGTIRPGMTRKQLMGVFTPQQAGLSSGLDRTFISRDCPYFKVWVEFRAVGHPNNKLLEGDQDVIVKISEPYLGGAVAD
jgi:hypothetical protein